MEKYEPDKTIEQYIDEFTEEAPEGMGLIIENSEGGGNIDDESKEFESRLEWLEETNGGSSHNIWKNLADNETEKRKDEELVFIEVPFWYIEDNDDWNKSLGNTNDYKNYAYLKPEKSDESGNGKSWCFSKLKVNGRWKKPRNKYNLIWCPRSCVSVYRKVGEPRPIDKETIIAREALPENVNSMKADEDDYNWKRALGAAYRRSEVGNSPTDEITEKIKELPDPLQKRVNVGVDKYVKLTKAEYSNSNKEITDEELARIMESLYTACKPGSVE